MLIVCRYLWPGYDEDSVNRHVILIAILVTVKFRQHLSTWDLFDEDPVRFSSVFRRILSMSIDTSLSPTVRTRLLYFLIAAFQSLDHSLVRKECAPLVSISIWHNLETESSRERIFEEHAQLKKVSRSGASLRQRLIKGLVVCPR